MSVQAIRAHRPVAKSASVAIAPDRRRAKISTAATSHYRAPHACQGRTRLPSSTPELTPKEHTLPTAVTTAPVAITAQAMLPLQDYRWRRARRIMLAVVASVILLAVLVALAMQFASTSVHIDAGSTIIVNSGDTLWSIASSHAPGNDVREVIAQIIALNDLPSTGIHAGQQLVLPAY